MEDSNLRRIQLSHDLAGVQVLTLGICQCSGNVVALFDELGASSSLLVDESSASDFGGRVNRGSGVVGRICSVLFGAGSQATEMPSGPETLRTRPSHPRRAFQVDVASMNRDLHRHAGGIQTPRARMGGADRMSLGFGVKTYRRRG